MHSFVVCILQFFGELRWLYWCFYLWLARYELRVGASPSASVDAGLVDADYAYKIDLAVNKVNKWPKLDLYEVYIPGMYRQTIRSS